MVHCIVYRMLKNRYIVRSPMWMVGTVYIEISSRGVGGVKQASRQSPFLWLNLPYAFAI